MIRTKALEAVKDNGRNGEERWQMSVSKIEWELLRKAYKDGEAGAGFPLCSLTESLTPFDAAVREGWLVLSQDSGWVLAKADFGMVVVRPDGASTAVPVEVHGLSVEANTPEPAAKKDAAKKSSYVKKKKTKKADPNEPLTPYKEARARYNEDVYRTMVTLPPVGNTKLAVLIQGVLALEDMVPQAQAARVFVESLNPVQKMKEAHDVVGKQAGTKDLCEPCLNTFIRIKALVEGVRGEKGDLQRVENHIRPGLYAIGCTCHFEMYAMLFSGIASAKAELHSLFGIDVKDRTGAWKQDGGIKFNTDNQFTADISYEALTQIDMLLAARAFAAGVMEFPACVNYAGFLSHMTALGALSVCGGCIPAYEEWLSSILGICECAIGGEHKEAQVEPAILKWVTEARKKIEEDETGSKDVFVPPLSESVFEGLCVAWALVMAGHPTGLVLEGMEKESGRFERENNGTSLAQGLLILADGMMKKEVSDESDQAARKAAYWFNKGTAFWLEATWELLKLYSKAQANPTAEPDDRDRESLETGLGFLDDAIDAFKKMEEAGKSPFFYAERSLRLIKLTVSFMGAEVGGLKVAWGLREQRIKSYEEKNPEESSAMSNDEFVGKVEEWLKEYKRFLDEKKQDSNEEKKEKDTIH